VISFKIGVVKKMGHVNSFSELKLYKLSRELAREVFEMTKKFPKEETYSLIDQVRRSSRSVGAQIAEAWGKRRYEKHFVLKLSDADGEQLETQHWIECAFDCKYINKLEQDSLLTRYQEVGKMINGMIK
jgi:four helix bundle protein